jgi:hypothetical protein
MRQLSKVPDRSISIQIGARCSRMTERGTARKTPAIITPGYTGVANSQRWRNQKLMNVACPAESPRRRTRSFIAAAETTAPPGKGMRPMATGVTCIASFGPMASSALASLTSIPFISIMRLIVSAQRTMPSSLRVCRSMMASSTRRGVSAGGSMRKDSSRLPANMASPG